MIVRKLLWGVVIFWGLGILAGPLGADEEATSLQEFEKLEAQAKDTLVRLRKLTVEYQTAPEARQQEIKETYDALVKEGDEVRTKLGRAAEQAVSDPKKFSVASRLILRQLRAMALGDDYQETLRLIKLLLPSREQLPADDQRFLLSTGMQMAFNLNEFELGLDYYEQLAKLTTPDKSAETLAGQLREHRQLWQNEMAIRQKEAAADDLPRVELNTSRGRIVLELFENEAPNTVANMISLVDKKFYDGLTFHRVISGFMAQGGDPKGDGSGGPGYCIPCECTVSNYRRHFRGSLSMAKMAERDTGGSQFFLTFVPTPNLNGQHTVFGRVIEGFDVLDHITRIQGKQRDAIEPDRIITAKVLRKRDHAYEPKTLSDPRR